MAGFLTGVVSIVDHEGNRVDTPNVEGDHAPVELQLGSTMAATKTTNGSLTRVTINATAGGGGEGGIVLALDTHDDFRALDITDVPDGTVVHFKTPVGVFVYEDSLGAGQLDDDRTILKLTAISTGSNGRAYSVNAPILPTIAALRLASSGKNEAVQVQAFSTAGDGGGGTFIKQMGTATDNGGTIIVPTGVSTFYYARQFSGPVDVRWFGARAIKESEFALGYDSSAAINAAIDLDRNSPYGGNWILIPPPKRGADASDPYGYKCASPLHIKQCVYIEGGHGSSEYAQTRIWVPASTGAFIVDMRDLGANVNGARSTIKGLMIIAKAKGSEDWLTGGANGILSNLTINLDGVFIYGFRGHGLEIHGETAGGQIADQGCIDNVRIVGCDGHGAYAWGSDAQANDYRKLEVASCGQAGIVDASLLGNTYSNNCNAASCGLDAGAATTWAPGISVTAGQRFKPTDSANKHTFVAAGNGTTHASIEPTWTTLHHSQVVSNGVTFTEAGMQDPTIALGWNLGGDQDGLESNSSKVYGGYCEFDCIVRVGGGCFWDGQNVAGFTDDSHGEIAANGRKQNSRYIVAEGPRSALTSQFEYVTAPYDQSATFHYYKKTTQSTDVRFTWGTGGGSGYRYLWAFSQPYLIFTDEEFTRGGSAAAGGGAWCLAHRGMMYNSWDRSGGDYARLHFQSASAPNGTGSGQEQNFIFKRGDEFKFQNPSDHEYIGKVNLRTGESPQRWSANAPVTLGMKIQPSDAHGNNEHIFTLTTLGTGNTGLTEPSWNTGTGATTADDTLVWTESGTSSDWRKYGQIGNDLFQVQGIAAPETIGYGGSFDIDLVGPRNTVALLPDDEARSVSVMDLGAEEGDVLNLFNPTGEFDCEVKNNDGDHLCNVPGAPTFGPGFVSLIYTINEDIGPGWIIANPGNCTS